MQMMIAGLLGAVMAFGAGFTGAGAPLPPEAGRPDIVPAAAANTVAKWKGEWIWMPMLRKNNADRKKATIELLDGGMITYCRPPDCWTVPLTIKGDTYSFKTDTMIGDDEFEFTLTNDVLEGYVWSKIGQAAGSPIDGMIRMKRVDKP